MFEGFALPAFLLEDPARHEKTPGIDVSKLEPSHGELLDLFVFALSFIHIAGYKIGLGQRKDEHNIIRVLGQMTQPAPKSFLLDDEEDGGRLLPLKGLAFFFRSGRRG